MSNEDRASLRKELKTRGETKGKPTGDTGALRVGSPSSSPTLVIRRSAESSYAAANTRFAVAGGRPLGRGAHAPPQPYAAVLGSKPHRPSDGVRAVVLHVDLHCVTPNSLLPAHSTEVIAAESSSTRAISESGANSVSGADSGSRDWIGGKTAGMRGRWCMGCGDATIWVETPSACAGSHLEVRGTLHVLEQSLHEILLLVLLIHITNVSLTHPPRT